MTEEARSNRRRSVVVFGAFVYLWVMVVVALATLALLGPMTWLTGRSEWAAWPYGTLSLGLLLLALLLLSLLVTRWLLRRTLLSRTSAGRAVIPAAVTLLALAGAWIWITGSGGTDTEEVSRLHALEERA